MEFEHGLEDDATVKRSGFNRVRPENERRVFKKIHKREVCRFWLQNTCAKGEACEWLHEMNADAMPYCSFDPHCTREGCMYKHGGRAKKNLCANYEAGFCSFGHLCKDAHEFKETLPPISALFLREDPCKEIVRQRQQTQRSFRKSPCPYFKSDGWCPYFFSCAFSHEK